jgi:hypothetical protein
VPKRYSLDPQLGRWIQKQRELFQNGKMAVERKSKLDEIGFEIAVQDKSNEENWNLQFKKLQDYYGKNGDCELFWAVDRSTFILNTPLTHHLCLYLYCRFSATHLHP